MAFVAMLSAIPGLCIDIGHMQQGHAVALAMHFSQHNRATLLTVPPHHRLQVMLAG